MEIQVAEQKCTKADNLFCSNLKPKAETPLELGIQQLMEEKTLDHYNVVGHFVEMCFVHNIQLTTVEEIYQPYLSAEHE